METKLLVRDGQAPERTIAMDSDEVWIGRGGECTVRTDDSLVSRKHAVLRRRDGKYLIEDLRSANGVYVNEQRIAEPRVVTREDVIRCGGVLLRVLAEPEVVILAAPPPPTPPPPPANRTLQRRVVNLSTQLADLDEVHETEKRTNEELRAELAAAGADIARLNAELVATRTALEKAARRNAQAEAELARAREDLERGRREVAEMARIKDDGWRQVNAHAADLEHLREVVRQQNAVLEERRVRILVLESQRP